MSTFRVLLDAAPEAGRADAWALFDDNGRVLQAGRSAPAAWPAADHREAIVAASCVRIVSLRLPPLPADRVATAAAFALEDQLAGPVNEQHIAVSPQHADGTVETVISSRALVARLGRSFDRVVAEPSLAPRPAQRHWRWYASGTGGGFVRRPDGSAFGTSAHDGIPAELRLALDHAARAGSGPVAVQMAFAAGSIPAITDGAPFVPGDAWRWQDATSATFANATDLRQGELAPTATGVARSSTHLLRLAAVVAALAVILHVVASVGEWIALRIDESRTRSALVSRARDAGITGDDYPVAAIARRHAVARHSAGLAAPIDALPLLARAAPALALLPAGTIKSATYRDGYWTFDLAKPDAGMALRVERQLAAAGLTTLQATNATGTRVRIALAAGVP